MYNAKYSTEKNHFYKKSNQTGLSVARTCNKHNKRSKRKKLCNKYRNISNTKELKLLRDNELLKRKLLETKNSNIYLNSKIDIIKLEQDTFELKYLNCKTELKKLELEQQMFNNYKNLPPDIKTSLKGIFKAETYENFIACGCQRSNIDTLWEFIKNRTVNMELSHLTELNEIFVYFIELFNGVSSNPVLKIQDVAIGEAFDTAEHIRTKNGKSSGKIAEVYLAGYQNILNNKILNKAIVRVN